MANEDRDIEEQYANAILQQAMIDLDGGSKLRPIVTALITALPNGAITLTQFEREALLAQAHEALVHELGERGHGNQGT